MPQGEGLSVEGHQEKALKKHNISVVRLQDELDHLIKIFSHMRECFENEMMDGLGYKKLALTAKQIGQGGELAKMMTAVVAAKIRFDKAAKQMADSMTPEEERNACLKYVQSLEPAERQTWLHNLREWMERRRESYPVVSSK